ncbi:hypothetical protein K505DRAFT_338705 [Melanomma pulvis-pyrius CBS 109.77]|uniref:Uncharacterized protein n=1 Tax=Melanomma pulvis-pyrius CBS 109.77 TaxID=1314802 RepID=A0A6A6X7A6_9PLEO|nr:hypothetical protein K505DRAFT_338705 [Melanomma pulvis-pyrius CBS 109.77]
MAIPFYHPTESLITPELGYALTHHLQDPYSPFVPSIRIYLDTFPSLTAAQIAAQLAIEDTTRKLSKCNFSDFVSKDIDFWTKALVTAGTTDGIERVLSLFAISAVNVYTTGWAPQMGGEETEALFAQKEGTEIVVRIPPAPAVAARELPVRIMRNVERDEEMQNVAQEPVCGEERASEGELNQTPQLRGRDEGAFRDGSGQPYGRKMGVDQDVEPSALGEEEDDKFSLYGLLGGGKDIGPIYRGRRHSASGL